MMALYRYGSWLVGLALIVGLGAVAVTGTLPPEADGVLYVTIPLFLLWSLPVLALIGAGVIAIQRKHTSLSGWLAVVMAIALSGLWMLV